MAVSDFTTAFRVRALSLDDKVGLCAGEEDPRTVETVTYPVGSIYFQTNGTIWRRVGPAPTDWLPESPRPGGPPPVPRQECCPWQQVVKAIQGISTEATVLRLIQSMTADLRCHHP